MDTPFYDPAKNYEKNYDEGPFGAFADGEVYIEKTEPEHAFFGNPIHTPFGIPAGPLINGKFMRAAMEKGFDVAVYKTVRTRAKKVNDWPNVLPVKVEGDLTLEKARGGLVVKEGYTQPLAITNSFGNPSFPPEVWQRDVAETVAFSKTRSGQTVSGMIEGTRWSPESTEQDFIDDWVLAARLMQETGVHAIEANFSCPNEGDRVKRLLCFDADTSLKIADAIKDRIGDTPLVIKVSYFESGDELRSLVGKLGRVVNGISAINTIPAPVYKEDGAQALPGGEWRLKSGICGAPVKWAGLEMTRRLKALRDEFDMRYTIIGVGGVTVPADYAAYRAAGADIVMSATGAMWNPHLAIDIKKEEDAG